MKSRPSLLLGTGILFLAATACRATTNYVAQNGQIPVPNYLTWETAASNIQDAVNVATANDTVLVADGTYTLTNQITLNKAINLRSVNGASRTFINGNYPHTTNRCIYIGNNSSVVDGFTLTNGYFRSVAAEQGGGGVMIQYKGTVANCVIRGNTCFGTNNWTGGGGIFLGRGGCVSNCVVANNTASPEAAAAVYNRFGGGVYGFRSGSILDCIVRDNVADKGGGIAQTYENTLLTSGCLVYDNTAVSSTGEGGIRLEGGQVRDTVISNNVGIGVGMFQTGNTLMNSQVVDNTLKGIVAKSSGAVISNCLIARNGDIGIEIFGDYGFYLVDRCRITANVSLNAGAGITCRNDGLIRNCLIDSNTNSGCNGGGVFMGLTAGVGGIQNCTITKNWALTQGGGLALFNTNRVSNCIIYDNICKNTPGQNIFWDPVSLSNTLFHCCAPVNVGMRLAPNPGNITDNPRFADAAAGNWRLRGSSPCVNAGEWAAWMAGDVDLDGRPRVRDSIVDMGPYEYLPAGAAIIVR